MPATLRLVLRTQKARADGACPVWLRVTAGRRTRFTSTGVFVEPRHWNEAKAQVRRTHPIAPTLNDKLGDVLMHAQESALSGGTAEAVMGRLSETSGSLSAFFRRFIDELDAKGAFWEWKKYRVTLGKLEAVFGPDVAFAALDRHALVRFERHLRAKLGNGPGTVLKELQRLRRVIMRAVRDGLLKPGDDPFLTYDRPRGGRVDRRKLNPEEIGQLAALDLGASPALALVRDAFLFAFYGAGIRFSDVTTLRPENVTAGRLEYRMMKTGTLVSIPLPPPALAIAARWKDAEAPAGTRLRKATRPFIYPFLDAGDDRDGVTLRRRIASANAKTNERLKELAVAAGIERPETVSFHVARHSYADFARMRGGDLFAISKSLGHGSLQITQTYLKSFDRDAVDRLSEQLWT